VGIIKFSKKGTSPHESIDMAATVTSTSLEIPPARRIPASYNINLFELSSKQSIVHAREEVKIEKRGG
jgi:hypothetical protein